jgi:uncharacterized integral membrane protein (TIGR00697 family)
MNNTNKIYYNSLTLIFNLLLLFSNIAEIKICSFFGYSVGAGTIVFPLIYILNDVITEVYGFSASRKIIWIALISNCVFSLFITLIVLLPSSPHFELQDAFEQIFLISSRIVAGSVISYFIGELLNAVIIATLKIKFKGYYFAFRAIFSTLVASFIESLIFALIAFYGRVPNVELFEMIILLTIIKVIYEILVMPFTIKFVKFLKVKEGINVFEQPTLKSIFLSFGN